MGYQTIKFPEGTRFLVTGEQGLSDLIFVKQS